MRSLSLVSGVGLLVIWLLLYVNELKTVPSLTGGIVYVAALLCPSVCFWIFAGANSRLSGQGKSERWILLRSLGVTLIVICSGVALMLLWRRPAQRTVPMLSSGLTALYACSLVLAVATLIRFPGMKRRMLHGNSLGWLALGVALGGLLAFQVAKLLAGESASGFGKTSSLLLDVWCLVAMLLAFLCLLSVSRAQCVLGVAALVGLMLLFIFSRFEVFFSIWLVGVLFWPFVILCTLVAETIAFRLVLPRLFSQIVEA